MAVVLGKADMATRLAERLEISKKNADEAIKGVIGVITDALVNGEEVTIKDFGKFSLAVAEGRNGRNPQNPSEVLKIAPSIRAKFKAGAGLANLINVKETADAIGKNNKDDKKLQDRLKAWRAAHK